MGITWLVEVVGAAYLALGAVYLVVHYVALPQYRLRGLEWLSVPFILLAWPADLVLLILGPLD